jgi:ABC-type multidrug transport system ATPase subunit
MELCITDLSKTYPNGVRALDGVSLTVPTGMFGLLGPNGAGKSTLMRTIATLQEPDSGSITLDGTDVADARGVVPTTPSTPITLAPGTARDKDRVRRLLGYLPQEFGVYPRITAETLLRHFATLKGIEPRRLDEVVAGLLHKTNLWDVRKRRLGTFSGGMKQRFGIAQALIGDPRLIIVDEPTAGLDPGERLRFLNLLSEIGENVVVILSTHIVEDVSDLCRRMAVISHGRVLLQGEPATALEALRGKVWCRAVARPDLAALEAEHDVISTHLLAGRTIVHVFAEDRPGLEWEPVDAGLADVYFSTLKHAGDRRAA